MAGENRCSAVGESILEWYGNIPGTNRYLAEPEDFFVFNQGGIAGETSRPFF
jgi:seryl-tRNA synthetase